MFQDGSQRRPRAAADPGRLEIGAGSSGGLRRPAAENSDRPRDPSRTRQSRPPKGLARRSSSTRERALSTPPHAPEGELLSASPQAAPEPVAARSRGHCAPVDHVSTEAEAQENPVGPSRLPPDGFTYCLTLSSECFSTFPHGTCSLSVSRPYLALDGAYHPLRAAFPNNPTPRLRAGARAGRPPRA